MSEKLTPERVAPQTASRPGTISYVIVGVMVLAFIYFIFMN